jgi:serine protease inhibitor
LQGSVINIANKAYFAEDVDLKRPYEDSIENFFKSSLETADFRDAGVTADRINQFVRSQTNGLIDKMVEVAILFLDYFYP